MRADFNSGLTIDQIASARNKDRDYVIEQITKDPNFKHEVDRDIEKYGFAQSPLLRRCYAEHFDEKALRRILTSKRMLELKEYLKLQQ